MPSLNVLPPDPSGASLQLFEFPGGPLLFSAKGKWLHPLFALEEWLSRTAVQPAQLYLVDTVIGKGAAVMLLYLGLRRCHGRLLSRGAAALLQRFNAVYSYDQLVDRIACQTETLITEDCDLVTAYQLIQLRRQQALLSD